MRVHKSVSISPMAQVSFDTDDTKTEIIQLMIKEVYCPSMYSLCINAMCSNVMWKNFLSTIYAGNKLLSLKKEKEKPGSAPGLFGRGPEQ